MNKEEEAGRPVAEPVNGKAGIKFPSAQLQSSFSSRAHFPAGMGTWGRGHLDALLGLYTHSLHWRPAEMEICILPY